MGQIGSLPQSAPIQANQTPYGAAFQSMVDASKARGWGVDSGGGFFANQSAGQNPANQGQWAQMMNQAHSNGAGGGGGSPWGGQMGRGY